MASVRYHLISLFRSTVELIWLQISLAIWFRSMASVNFNPDLLMTLMVGLFVSFATFSNVILFSYFHVGSKIEIWIEALFDAMSCRLSFGMNILFVGFIVPKSPTLTWKLVMYK